MCKHLDAWNLEETSDGDFTGFVFPFKVVAEANPSDLNRASVSASKIAALSNQLMRLIDRMRGGLACLKSLISLAG